jgi:transglutaminase-like putative cysteine protease
VSKKSFYNMLLVICVDIILVSILLTTLMNSNEPDIGLDSFFANSRLSLNPLSSEALPPTVDESSCTQRQSSENMCLYVYTGTVRSVYQISNPNGISGFQEYHLVNFQQRLLGATATAIEVEVVSEYYVDTHTPYPVDRNTLPENIRNTYLQPQPGWIQSDDPEIVAQANHLIAGATRQAEAVDAILTWVRAHIKYDYAAPANDALSVFRNRRAVCSGFTSLSVALLRAAGIPSRYHRGCATPFGYVTGEEGGWHAWVETYYPDVGWVASEPQSSANVIKPGVIFQGFDQCGRSGTVITRTSYVDDSSYMYILRTPYDNSIRYSFQTASIPAWDRHPLSVTPLSPTAMLPVTNPIGGFALQIENLSCSGEDWQVRTAAPWLSPQVITGTSAGSARFSINASGMYTGVYSTPLTLYTTSLPEDWNLRWAISRTVTANLFLVDKVYQTYLPIVAKNQ